MRRLSVFSWGYWGWGNATRQLVAAVDAAERRRGFNPPIFVDIRYRRTGRAAGFKGDAFEELLGWRRYRWMPSLGNSSIGTGRRIRIACPMAANQLLDLALDAADRSRRVIFFCACESPWLVPYCHRHTVAQLVSRAARRRGLSVDVSEWPGGLPSSRVITHHVSPETIRAVESGAKAVTLNRKRIPVDLAGLPWGTLVMLKAGRHEYPVTVGPAAYRSGQWVLPLFREDPTGQAQEIPALRRQVKTLRRRYSLD